MGTYTDFTVAGYTIISTKSSVLPELMTVFRETDRRAYKRHTDKQTLIDSKDLSEIDPDYLEDVVEYACEVNKVIDRLNIMGFTLLRAKREFEQGRESELLQYRSRTDDTDDEDFQSWYATKIELLESLTFENYLEGFSIVITEKIYSYSVDEKPRAVLSPLLRRIVEDTDEHLFGFFMGDIRCLVRIACEVTPKDQLVIQDISQIVSGGYYELDAPVCTETIQALVAGHPENSTQIILTEGSTDASILRRALNILYPHLVGYYSFLDFETSRSPGGAGHLVSLVKAFAATGITNRVIALFDNDTAAREARRSLVHIQLPSNIVVRSYPDIELLRSYPTLGPSGETHLDVNGLAASIELYLGVDILQPIGKSLTPVQWKGYSESLGQYQGEVMRKPQLQQAFEEKAEAAQVDPARIACGDWSGLSAILRQAFTAFDDAPPL